MPEEVVGVLVVDDEETIRNVLKRILEGAGYPVVTARDGEEALRILSQQEFELALLDVRMPGISGMELLGKITTDFPDTTVIMVTAVAELQTAVDAMKLDACDYITKPFDRDDLLEKVRKANEKRRHQVEDRRHYLELKKKFMQQTHLMRDQFSELVASLAREHKMLQKMAAAQTRGKNMLSELPPELQNPISSTEEFRDALLRILKRS
jgi:DNA-binding NtrC family response regulator